LAGFQLTTEGATNALYMNDASERQHGMDLLHEVIEQGQRRSRSPFFKAYCQAAETMLRRLSTGASYVFCLSSEGNQLSQWRAYAANGGYCIGFDAFKLLATFRIVEPKVRLHKVIYRQTTQVRLFSLALQKHFLKFLLIKKTTKAADQVRLLRFAHDEWVTDDELTEALNDLGPLYLHAHRYFSIFKNPAYREEAEWRIVLMDVTPSGFRASSDFLIPYRGIQPKASHKLPITSIRVGPRENPQLSIEAVEGALLKFGYGYSRIKALDSGIPLRQLKTFV
jgi:hypothetical protein